MNYFINNVKPQLEKCCNNPNIVFTDNRDSGIESIIKCNNCKQCVSSCDGYELKEFWRNASNFEELTNWLLEKCCDNPDIIFTDFGEICNERNISCRNCFSIVTDSKYDMFLGRSIGEKWNNTMVERARKKREVVKVDVNEYPFVYAMR